MKDYTAKKSIFYLLIILVIILSISLISELTTDQFKVSAACDMNEVSEGDTVNLLANPGFEVNTTGWFGIGSPNLQISNTEYKTGCQSLEVSNRTFNYEGPGVDMQSIGVNGKIYRVSAWLKSSTSPTATFRGTLKITDAAGTSYKIIDTVTINNTSWTKLIGYFTYQTTGSISESIIYFEQDGSDLLESTFYLDDVIIEEVPASSSYYVDPINGSDDNSGRSELTPWATLSNISNHPFQPGDSIKFKRGNTFTASDPIIFSSDGTSGNPINITNYGSGALPIFENNDVATDNESIFQINGDYYEINNLVFTDTTSNNLTDTGILFVGSNNLVQDSEISNVGFGVKIFGNNNQVIDNYIHDLKMVVNTNNSGSDDYGSVGVSIEAASNILVENNRFENIGAASFDFGLDGAMVETYRSCSDITVRYNIAINGESMLEIGSDNNTDLATDYFYHHNIIVDFRSPIGAIHNYSGSNPFSLNISNIHIENNTFIKNSVDNSGFVIGFDAPPNVDEIFVINNIFDIDNVLNWALSPGSFNHKYNVYQVNNITNFQITLDSTEINGTNSYADSLNNNFRLIEGSTAIDIGTDLGYTRDFYATSLPKGNGFEIGAAEFVPVVNNGGGGNNNTGGGQNSNTGGAVNNNTGGGGNNTIPNTSSLANGEDSNDELKTEQSYPIIEKDQNLYEGGDGTTPNDEVEDEIIDPSKKEGSNVLSWVVLGLIFFIVSAFFIAIMGSRRKQ